MSLKSAPFYWVECDYPGCGDRPEYGDYAAWADAGQARDWVDDWVLGYGPDEDNDYCPEHTTWDVDLDERVPVTTVLA